MTLTLRWRVPDSSLPTRWRGPQGMSQALARDPAANIAAIIGPPGPQGPAARSEPLRIEAPFAATWNLAHPLGHVPAVQVYLTNGEPVLADLVATDSRITVTFPAPQAGFVLAY